MKLRSLLAATAISAAVMGANAYATEPSMRLNKSICDSIKTSADAGLKTHYCIATDNGFNLGVDTPFSNLTQNDAQYSCDSMLEGMVEKFNFSRYVITVTLLPVGVSATCAHSDAQ